MEGASRESRIKTLIEECGGAIQVALDFTELWEALRLASLMPSDPRVIIEAGTPLIKSVGVRDAIPALKGAAGGRPLVADTKTVDAGSVEATLAAEAGADAISVLSAAHDSTFKEAVEASRGMSVYMDLITSSKPLDDVERAKRLGVDVVLFHVGIDVQRALGLTGKDLADMVKRASDAGVIVAVAGGIKPREVESLVSKGASIVVIGGGITKASNPREAALKALEGLERAGAKCR